MTARDRLPDLPAEDSRNLAYRLDETYWGYIIRQRRHDDLRIDILQALSGVCGLGFISAAAAVWAVPGSIVDGDVLLFKAIVSGMSCVFGILFLIYAGAGRHFELQVDLTRRELREAMRNSKGRVRIGRRHQFDDVAKVVVYPASANVVDAALMIGFHGSDLMVEVVTAPEHQLYGLRSRIARDVTRGQSPARNQRATASQNELSRFQPNRGLPAPGLRAKAQ